MCLLTTAGVCKKEDSEGEFHPLVCHQVDGLGELTSIVRKTLSEFVWLLLSPTAETERLSRLPGNFLEAEIQP